MNERSDIGKVLVHWFEDGPSKMPDRVVGDVADRIAREPQRGRARLISRRRARIQAGVAVAAVVALVLLTLFAIALVGGSRQTVQPSPRPAIEPNDSNQPRPTPIATPSPLTLGPGVIVVEVVGMPGTPNQLRYLAPDLRLVPLLPDFGGHQRTAAWRPDGERLAFAGRPAGASDEWMDLYETEPDGTSVRLLSTDCDLPTCVEETDPAYSPEGTRVAAVRLADLQDGEPTRSVLVIHDLGTGRATEIPNTSFPYDTNDIGHPRWSPDGGQIVFHVVDGPPTERRQPVLAEPTPVGASSIFVIGIDGSGLRQLTPDGVSAGDPDWSADGLSIVFGPTSPHLWLYGRDSTNFQIQAIRPDGSDRRVVVPPPDVNTPSWTAGGAQILFTESYGRSHAIRIVAADGSSASTVASLVGFEIPLYPVQQPRP